MFKSCQCILWKMTNKRKEINDLMGIVLMEAKLSWEVRDATFDY